METKFSIKYSENMAYVLNFL